MRCGARRIGVFNSGGGTHNQISSLSSRALEGSSFVSVHPSGPRVLPCARQRRSGCVVLYSQPRLQAAWLATSEARLDTIFDALCALPAGASTELTSWSGGLEVGVVAAAPVPKEGSKARKKRKLQSAQDGSATQRGSVEQSALWASPQAQQQAYRCVACLHRLGA